MINLKIVNPQVATLHLGGNVELHFLSNKCQAFTICGETFRIDSLWAHQMTHQLGFKNVVVLDKDRFNSRLNEISDLVDTTLLCHL